MSTLLLDEMCRHCNNYFNPKNDPAVPVDERNFPASFIELAGRIEGFIESVGERNNVTAASVASGSESIDLEYAAWQKTYARDLSVWKRARFI